MAIRITGGVWRGRLLKVPKKGVRPTQDRVRAAIFSSLQDVVPGASVLDLFAGSGAFGLEALSRGAACAWFVEKSSRAADCLKFNIAGLAPEAEWRVVRDDALAFLDQRAGDACFDIVFADPPYRDGSELTKKILCHLSARSILADDGLLIAETGSGESPCTADGWQCAWNRNYGETRVCMYRRWSPAAAMEARGVRLQKPFAP